MNENVDIIEKLPPALFVKLVKLAIWATEGKKLDMELAYQDEELMLFRRKVPLSSIEHQ